MIDDSVWQVMTPPRQTIGEYIATLPADLLPPPLVLHRTWRRDPNGGWLAYWLPDEHWRPWMALDYRPQLAIEGPRTTP